MKWTNFLKWAGAIGICLVFAFALFTPFNLFNFYSDFNDKYIEKNSGDHQLNNHIENNIDAENAEVTNDVKNNIQQGNHVNLDNHVTNNIDVAVDVQLSNNIDNDMASAQEKSGKDEEENGNQEENNNGEENGDGDNGEGNATNGNGNGNGENGTSENGTTDEMVWGVDSASVTDETMLACVNDNFGDPEVWGRYLGTKEDVSYGLTEEEVALLHEHDINILVIWNHFEDATGYEKGYSESNRAIEYARDFGVPEGVALFANVEPIYPIDSSFIQGWYDASEESEFEAGIYGIFDPDEELYVAFEAAAEENEELLDEMYVWTASPNVGITTEANAPEYNPDSPENATVTGWQYGIDAETCNIDTNWFDGAYLDVLW